MFMKNMKQRRWRTYFRNYVLPFWRQSPWPCLSSLQSLRRYPTAHVNWFFFFLFLINCIRVCHVDNMISLSPSPAIGWKLQDLILPLMRMISTRCYLSFSLNPVLWISVTGVFSSSHQVCWLIFINLLTKATVWVFCSFVLLVISGLDTMDKALKLSGRTVRGSKFAVTTVLPIKLVRCGLSRAGTLPFILWETKV